MMTLTDRQRTELDNLTHFPPISLDDEAALELQALGLVALVERGRADRQGTYRWRVTARGRAVLSDVQRKALDETERIEHIRARLLLVLAGGA